MEAATWNGPNIQRTSTRLGAAHRGVGPLREGAPARAGARGPGGRDAADARAVRRAAGRRDDRRRRPRAGAASRCACATRARSGCSARPSRARTRAADPRRALGFGVARAPTTGSTSTVPPWRRDDVDPRGRPDRGGRAHLGARPAPGDAALAPRRGRPARARAAAAPPGRGRAASAPGLSEVVGWSFTAPDARRRLGLPTTTPSRSRTRCPRTSRSCARRCSARCSTRCAATRSRGIEDVRLFEAGAVYLPRARRRAATARPATPGTRRTTRTLPAERTHIAALLTGPAAAAELGRARAAARRLLRRQGRARGAARARCASRWQRRAGRRRAVPAPGPRARVRAASARTPARAGSASCTRPSPRAGTSTRVAGFELDFGVAGAAARRPSRATRTSRRSPRSARTSRSWSPTTSRRARRARGRPRRRRRAAARRRGLRRLPRRAGRRGPRLARAAARVPRARPHADRRGGRRSGGRRSSPRCASRSGASCVAERSGQRRSAPAGYAGALAALLVDRHPHFELAHVTARSRGRRAARRPPPAHARAAGARDLGPRRQGDVDAALVGYPHGAAAPAVAALRERGVRVVDLSADFRLRDRAIYEDWYGEHGAPELLRQRRLRAARAAPRRDRRRRPRRQPRLLPDRGAARARAARPRRADRRRRRSTRSPASRAPAASRPPPRTSSPPTRTSRRTRSSATATRPRSSRSSPGRARRVTVTFTPHLVPLAQGELVSCYVTPARDARRGRARGALRRRLRARAVRRAADSGRPACSTCATPTSAGSPSTATARTGRILGLRRDRQPLEGRRVAGGPEPQPDVRARRARGAAVSWSPRAGSSRPRT